MVNEYQNKNLANWGPEIRSVIFNELSREIGLMLTEMALHPKPDQSGWLMEQAQLLVMPYVNAGANFGTMMYWAGMLTGARMRKVETVTNYDIPFEETINGG